MSRRIIIRCFLAISFMSLTLSCHEREVVIDSLEKELFLKSEVDGLYRNGAGILVMDEKLHQKTYNLDRNTFRLQTDNQSEYFNAEFESLPKNKGVQILTKLTYYSEEEESTSTLLLECSKIEGRKLWFWDSNEKIGIIVSSDKI